MALSQPSEATDVPDLLFDVTLPNRWRVTVQPLIFGAARLGVCKHPLDAATSIDDAYDYVDHESAVQAAHGLCAALCEAIEHAKIAMLLDGAWVEDERDGVLVLRLVAPTPRDTARR